MLVTATNDGAQAKINESHVYEADGLPSQTNQCRERTQGTEHDEFVIHLCTVPVFPTTT
jgi:hypothetical protein